jgi:hypothetical protein
MDVTVVHLMPWLMERQLDRTAANLLQRSLEAKGLAFRLEAKTEALLPGESGRVAAVQLAGGETLQADLVVMAVGIRPNVRLAQSAGLHCDRGIVVNDTLQTFDPRVYAIGECVNHRGSTYGLVAPLFDMAKVCANHLAQSARPCRVANVDQAQGHWNRSVFGRRFPGRTRHRGDRAVRPRVRRLQEAGAEGRQAHWQRSVRRHRRRVVVFQAAARRPQGRGHPRPPDVRRIELGRHGIRASRALALPGIGGGLRLQRRMQGHDRQGDQGRDCSPSTKCVGTPRRRRRAARAPVSSSSC